MLQNGGRQEATTRHCSPRRHRSYTQHETWQWLRAGHCPRARPFRRSRRSAVRIIHQLRKEMTDQIASNWTYKRKMLATSCILMYTLMIALPSGSVYSVVKPIEKATGLTLNDLNTGTGVMFLAYGWACVIWQPLALQYGKRPMYLFSMLASIAIMTSAPWCTNRSTYLANKVLQGFFGAPVEALCEISITDIWFAHERPKYLAWYGFGLSVTGKLAPMLAGFINDGQDWRWVLWWTAIWIAIAFVYCFFLMEG